MAKALTYGEFMNAVKKAAISRRNHSVLLLVSSWEDSLEEGMLEDIGLAYVSEGAVLALVVSVAEFLQATADRDVSASLRSQIRKDGIAFLLLVWRRSQELELEVRLPELWDAFKLGGVSALT